MNLVMTTLATPGHFAHYLPLYTYCIVSSMPEWTVRTFITGEIDEATDRAFELIRQEFPHVRKPVTHVQEAIADDTAATTEGAANLKRFLLDWDDFATLDPEYILITDVDLLLFEDPLAWHLAQMEMQKVYAGHHGPFRRPYRPEISGVDGWRGEFERVAGGFFMVTKEWFEYIRPIQKDISYALYAGWLSPGWRELDEVMLGRMIKKSGLPMPAGKHFPPNLRGVHLGDFKDSMTHRWTNVDKMCSKLTDENCLRFRTLEADPVWQAMLRELKDDAVLMRVLANVRSHLNEREL